MSKKILLFFLLPILSYSQKSFHFDYMLTYEFATIHKEDSITTQQIIYLTNSKDNSYFIQLNGLNAEKHDILFVKQDQFKSEFTASKKEFNETEVINLTCEYIKQYKNTYKHVAKKYEFSIPKDTLIHNKTYKTYTFKSVYTLKKTVKKRFGC